MFAHFGCQNATAHGPLDQDRSKPIQTATSLLRDGGADGRLDRRFDSRTLSQRGRLPVAATKHAVQVSPPDIVKRRILTWHGMAAEMVQATTREKLAFRFHAPLHLLVAWEQAVRSDGESFVEGLPRSRLRDVRRKLTFVPADHEYSEWGEPRVLTRVMHFYFDPDWMPTFPETAGFPSLAPRLFFEDHTLWNTALKLNRLIENSGSESSLYIHALGTVLAHELVRQNAGAPRLEASLRGGLAGWQQRTVVDYIEEHLADQISLSTLAQLARLSPYYFCRAFKQSFGMPPHRYHNSRRIEHAKMLLAKPASSVTDIGLTLGFSETSSFTAAFHRSTGFTPTAYRRSLISLSQA
jgi:AraC family transcriptional regulator